MGWSLEWSYKCGTCRKFCPVPGDEENRNSKREEEMEGAKPA